MPFPHQRHQTPFRIAGKKIDQKGDGKTVTTTKPKTIALRPSNSPPQASGNNPPPMMEVEYGWGVSQNPAIVQGIKSAYIEILCLRSSNITKVIDQCVSDVFENLLTYTVSVWQEETNKNNEKVLRLDLYVVWKGLPHTTPVQVAQTTHAPDDTHKHYVRTPEEILTYLIQILPRETSVVGCHEIICSPLNIINTIIYARGYVPGNPD